MTPIDPASSDRIKRLIVDLACAAVDGPTEASEKSLMTLLDAGRDERLLDATVRFMCQTVMFPFGDSSPVVLRLLDSAGTVVEPSSTADAFERGWALSGRLCVAFANNDEGMYDALYATMTADRDLSRATLFHLAAHVHATAQRTKRLTDEQWAALSSRIEPGGRYMLT